MKEGNKLNKVLKYPGSKWRIADKLVDLIPPHHTYLEPYFGSGAVFFRKQPSDIESINDLDHNVVNLFRCIQEDSERLARIVMLTPYARELYDQQFDSHEEPLDKYEKARNFLIRCWQGHGYRTNGYKVGWKNDVQGREKMYALWNWYRLPQWIMEIAERLRKVQIENLPALDLIKRFDYESVFMYIDPPYLMGTRAGKQYAHEMTDSDHEELLQTLLKSRAMIMISGYDSEMYNDMLSGWQRKEFISHTEKSVKRTEIIWMNYEIGQMELKLN